MTIWTKSLDFALCYRMLQVKEERSDDVDGKTHVEMRKSGL